MKKREWEQKERDHKTRRKTMHDDDDLIVWPGKSRANRGEIGKSRERRKERQRWKRREEGRRKTEYEKKRKARVERAIRETRKKKEGRKRKEKREERGERSDRYSSRRDKLINLSPGLGVSYSYKVKLSVLTSKSIDRRQWSKNGFSHRKYPMLRGRMPVIP